MRHGQVRVAHNQREQDRLICDLAAGMVLVNGNVTSYPRLPFGRVKNSGHGRELSVQGIREFCNIKAGWIGGPGVGPDSGGRGTTE
jgi:succinate-semialdehyde dehydrogenase/glutarate-semialdehyde dehydrogenase